MDSFRLKVEPTREKIYATGFKLQAAELTFQAGRLLENVASKLAGPEQPRQVIPNHGNNEETIGDARLG
jgi:hypothetical protein